MQGRYWCHHVDYFQNVFSLRCLDLIPSASAAWLSSLFMSHAQIYIYIYVYAYVYLFDLFKYKDGALAESHTPLQLAPVKHQTIQLFSYWRFYSVHVARLMSCLSWACLFGSLLSSRRSSVRLFGVMNVSDQWQQPEYLGIFWHPHRPQNNS